MENNRRHEHIIGLLTRKGFPRLVTLTALKGYIDIDMELSGRLKCLPEGLWIADNQISPYNLADYGNLDKQVGLVHFMHCPKCGEKINWEAIKRSE